MANEAGAGCTARGYWGTVTLISNVAASIGGSCDRLAMYTDSYDIGDALNFAFFTRTGNNFTTVAGTRQALTVAAADDSCKEFNAPGDFTAFNVSAGNYLGAYHVDDCRFADSGGTGIWYTAGDHTTAAAYTFTNEASGIDSLTADITEASGGISIPIAMHHLTKNIG